MKSVNWIMAVAVVGLLAMAGCSKAPVVQKTQNINGVDVALPELQMVLRTNTTPAIQESLGKMAFGLRYRDLPAVSAELDKLANEPSLTDAQKKLVAQVAEQVKQAESKAPANPH